MNRRSKAFVQESKEACNQLRRDVSDILEMAVTLAEELKDSGYNYVRSLNDIENSVTELARIEFEASHIDRALESIDREMAAPDTQSQEPRNFGDEYEERLAAVKGSAANFDPRVAPSVVAFRARVRDEGGNMAGPRSNGGEEEEELVLGGVKRSLECPLTKKQFEEPVRSRKCGHSYSKAAILEHITRRRDAKCPVCGQIIKEEDLESDRGLVKLLKKEARNHRKKPTERAVQL